MKFIDEKGRLFGKINLIDLLVILLVLAVLFAVLWKTVGKRASENANAQTIRAEYTVLCADTPKEICAYAENQVGEKLLNNAVFLDATITGCVAEPRKNLTWAITFTSPSTQRRRRRTTSSRSQVRKFASAMNTTSKRRISSFRA